MTIAKPDASSGYASYYNVYQALKCSDCPGMENVPTRTLTINPAADWLAAAGAFMARVRLAVRAFGEALHKEPVRSRAKSPRGTAPRTSPWMEPGELPETYGCTRVVAMVVSPYLVHVYWDLSAKDQKQSGSGCLRFHDATAGGSFDVNVDLAARNWYVHLWSPEKRYSVELGLRRADTFQILARSNPIETPRAWPVADVAHVSEPAPQTAPLAAGQPEQPRTAVSEPPLLPASVAPPAPAAPKSMRSGDVAPSVEPPATLVGAPAPVVPPNALETLRRRLTELYGYRRWLRPLPAGPECTAVEESVSSLPEAGSPATQTDFTERLERQFSPGLSSAQLQNPKPPRG